MRTRDQTQVVCDGCGRFGVAHRVGNALLTQQGVQQLGKLEMPPGWRAAMVKPEIAPLRPQPHHAGTDAETLARATGCVVEAALCEKCVRKSTFTPLPIEVEPLETLSDAESHARALGGVDAAAEVDPRQVERDAERQRAEAEAEAAERAALRLERRGAMQ